MIKEVYCSYKVAKLLKEKGFNIEYNTTMKKFILLAFTVLMIVGCSNQNDIAKSVEEGDFSTIKYDSCEYLLRISISHGYLAHKGNCKFCKERRQKELKELVEQLKEGLPK